MGHAIWEEFLKIIKQEAGSRVVDTWFKALTLRQWDSLEQTIYLDVPNRFVKDWIQGHYAALMQLHLGRLLNVQSLKVVLKTKETDVDPGVAKVVSSRALPDQRFVAAKKALPVRTRKKSDYINSAYTFDNFVVGPSNSLAYASAKAVTDTPGRLYNPLFFYGGSGLGKTHLLHAIGNEVKAKYKKVEVLYQTADHFVSEFINAIRFDKVHYFRSKYKVIDLLIVDDIQFISNKEQTQEIFFHIFNFLYDAHKQLIFSSDSIPQNLAGIADRLRSRLGCGLVADLRLPSLETKVAILKRKAESNGEVLPDEVAHCIASYVVHSIRELEGLLVRVMAFSSLVEEPITVELAKKILEHSNPQNSTSEKISCSTVISVVRKHYSYTLADLSSKNRNKHVSFVRQIAIFLIKELTAKSLREIGTLFGNRDHSTILYAVEKITKAAQHDKLLDEKIKSLIQEVHSFTVN